MLEGDEDDLEDTVQTMSNETALWISGKYREEKTMVFGQKDFGRKIKVS